MLVAADGADSVWVGWGVVQVRSLEEMVVDVAEEGGKEVGGQNLEVRVRWWLGCWRDSWRGY